MGHIIHGAAAYAVLDGQCAMVGDRMAALIGQGLTVQVEGDSRIRRDSHIFSHILEKRDGGTLLWLR